MFFYKNQVIKQIYFPEDYRSRTVNSRSALDVTII